MAKIFKPHTLSIGILYFGKIDKWQTDKWQKRINGKINWTNFGSHYIKNDGYMAISKIMWAY
jgi:hypothetical protein